MSRILNWRLTNTDNGMTTSDETVKNFWKNQMQILILKFAAQASLAIGNSDGTDDSEKRIENYKKEYQEKVDLQIK